LEKIRGSYALGMMFADHPDAIYAVRHDSPLIIGLGEDENFIASDMTALLRYTRRYYLLNMMKLQS
jgi:glutamine---fructose-6-phosphate transaminase (isomerizing)